MVAYGGEKKKLIGNKTGDSGGIDFTSGNLFARQANHTSRFMIGQTEVIRRTRLVG